MAESDKGAAPANKAEGKSSLLDDDISKDFLGSWGTMFNSDDSSSGFNLEPIPKGKKREFDFDKLDFNLDGEFDNITSFKVDMGDLDFSSPPKASTKSKETDLDFSSPPKNATKSAEKKEGDSAKSNKGKQDCFAFSFDFSELDKFDIDTELTKTKQPSKVEGNQGVKIASIDEADRNGSKIQSVDANADAGAEAEGAAEAESSLVKESKLKESVSARKDVLDLPQGSNLSESYVPVKDQLEPKQCKISSGKEDTDQMSIPEEKIHKQSGEVPKLQNRSAETPKDQIESKLDVVSSERETLDHAREQQSHNVEKTCSKSYEELQMRNQSFTDKKNTLNVLQTIHVHSLRKKSGGEDSEEEALNAVEPALGMGDENLLQNKMMPPHESLHLKNPSLGVSESESTHTEKNKRQSCLISRFNLKPLIKDRAPAAAQASPARANLVSLSRSAISSSHPSSSGARHDAHVAQIRSSLDKNLRFSTQEVTGGCCLPGDSTINASNHSVSGEHSNPMEALMKKQLDVKPVPIDGKTAEKGIVFQGNDKKKVDSKYFREHSNPMEAPMEKKLDVVPVPNDGKTAEKGTAFQGDDKKKPDSKYSRPSPMESMMKKQLDVTPVPKDGKTTEKGTALQESDKKLGSKYSGFQVQASSLPDWTSESHNIANEEHEPKIPSMQSVRKLKMDTIVCKLSTLNVSKKISDRSSLKSSNSTPLEDKIVMGRNLGANISNLTTRTAQLVGLRKLQSPSPSIKRKTAEASDAAPAILPPPKRLSTSQSRNSNEDSEGLAQKGTAHQTSLKIGLHKNILDSSLENNPDKQPQPTSEVSQEMRSAEVEVPMLIEDDGNIQKSEAYGTELDQICSILRKKQDEAKDLLIRALVTSNNLLLLGNPLHDRKLCEVQKFASGLMSRELPSRSMGTALQ